MIIETTTETHQREIYSVSQLNRTIRDILEDCFSQIWVEGEISNLKKPSSGHLYFSLKDDSAQVSCAMFRNRHAGLTFEPEDGMHVILRGMASVYEERGSYQLIVDYLEKAGDGALQRAFEQLKQKLAQEGLFNAIHKKAIPILPKQIGVVTSPTGAAIRDILTILKRRFPAIPIIIYPTQVQGSLAAKQIVKAIQIANQRNECEVLIVARGGGSLEDLWPFNEEIVARAIFQSAIPIVTGIGHEIDFTIADFVADHRAPTPSAAAELVSPNQQEWLSQYQKIQIRIISLIKKELQQQLHHVQHLTKRLRHPGDFLRERMQRIDYIEQTLRQLLLNLLQQKSKQLDSLDLKLQQQNPKHLINILKIKNQGLQQQLVYLINEKVNQVKHQLQIQAHALNTVSPLATLDRGYAIVFNKQNHEIIRTTQQISVGDKIQTRLKHGELLCTIDEIVS